jgi:hypothetical protein
VTANVQMTPETYRLAFALEGRWGLVSHTAQHAAALMLAKPGLTITSGRRTPEENARIGGSPRSFHLQGRAVDFAAPLGVLIDANVIAKRQRITDWCTGPEEVLLEHPGDLYSTGLHLHVAW